MSRTAAICLCALLPLASLACKESGPGRPAAAATGAATKASKPAIALLVTAHVNDHGWNELAYRAAMELGESLGVAVSTVVRGANEAFDADIRDFADKGYKLVICHGGEYEKKLLQVARDVPDMSLACSGGQGFTDNVVALTYHLEDATYLAGIVAAKMTKTRKLAAIGGQNFQTVERTLKAFEAGAKSVDPRIECSVTYADTWTEADVARSAIQPYLAAGADVVFQNTDAAGRGIFDAVSQRPGCWAFGSNADQNGDETYGKIILGSAVIDMKKAFEPIIKEALAGRVKGRNVAGRLENGIIDFRVNPVHEKSLPAGTMDLLDKARQDIISGKTKVVGGT